MRNKAESDLFWMGKALALADQAGQADEVPVGAVIVQNGALVSQARNDKEAECCATCHAEINVIEDACRTLGRWRLSGCTLYVTLEPCLMCAGAIIQARVDRVVIGARDPKAGAVFSLYQVLSDPRLNHRPEVVEGVGAEKSTELLQSFFRRRREEKKTKT